MPDTMAGPDNTQFEVPVNGLTVKERMHLDFLRWLVYMPQENGRPRLEGDNFPEPTISEPAE